MKSIVIYATRKGNTKRVAEAIAAGLRSASTVEVRDVADGAAPLTEEVDLLVIGGPTEGHGVTEPMVDFLDRLPASALVGRAAAAFDTRVRWPRFLSGSAAEGIRQRLEQAGVNRPVPTESFLVTMKPEVEPDELERAHAWGAALATGMAPPLAVAGATRT
jgi:flavodoxin